MHVTDNQRRDDIAGSIAAFERHLEVRICVHDYLGAGLSFLPTRNTYHSHRACRWIRERCRRQFGRDVCGEVDGRLIADRLARDRQRFVKHCHGDIIELVFPLFLDGTLRGDVCVGPFAHNASLDPKSTAHSRLTLVSPYLRRSRYGAGDIAAAMRGVSVEEAGGLFDLFQPLVSCIEQAASSILPITASEDKREWQVRRFLSSNYTLDVSATDLAARLCLSVSRTQHFLKDVFGKSFSQLVTDYRMERAKSYLKHTILPIAQVAELSGFRNAGYFYRSFREREGTTPSRFRRERIGEIQT